MHFGLNKMFILLLIIATLAKEGYTQTCCDSSPCLNGGTCYAQAGGSYVCSCIYGYSGVNCQFSEN